MQLLAPAKINLHLRVGRRRGDGFHPLLSWMCTVGLFDRLTLEADADAALGSNLVDPRGAAAPSAGSGFAGASGPGGEVAGGDVADIAAADIAGGSDAGSRLAEALVALELCGD